MITESLINTRQTKYCNAIKKAIKAKGHATNNELLYELRLSFPDLSATTVHRATARLASRGEIGTAPASKDGAMRYDANPLAHDHFKCSYCDLLRDIDIKDRINPILKVSIGDCQISGRLTISGVCKKCIKLIRKE